MNKQQQLQLIIKGLTRMVEIVEDFTAREFSDYCEAEKLSAVEIAQLQHQLQKANEQADTVKKTVGKVFDHTRTFLLPARMEEEGISGFKIKGVGRVNLTSDMRVSMKDKEAGYAWLEENDHGDLVTETVNASTLKALLSRMIRDGKEVPEDIFKISPFDRASITKE